jgi:prolipoprotein diacylglyceryl transferase
MSITVWDMNPVLLSIGPLHLRWYGLLFASGIFSGLYILRWIYRREGRDVDETDDLLLYAIAGIVVGARLAHCLIYEPSYYLSHPIEILFVWRGGLASHGGLLGMFLATWLFCKKHGISFVWLVSRLTIPGSLFAFFVRMGNFFNSEILGRATDAPWAIIFARYDGIPRHPAQLYEAIAYLLIFTILLLLYMKLDREKTTALLPGIFFTLVFSARFFIEDFKMRQASYATDMAMSVGQLLSIPFILMGIVWFSVGLVSIVKSD